VKKGTKEGTKKGTHPRLTFERAQQRALAPPFASRLTAMQQASEQSQQQQQQHITITLQASGISLPAPSTAN
jgi:hypothetical protein